MQDRAFGVDSGTPSSSICTIVHWRTAHRAWRNSGRITRAQVGDRDRVPGQALATFQQGRRPLQRTRP
jgi:hypothetical protein